MPRQADEAPFSMRDDYGLIIFPYRKSWNGRSAVLLPHDCRQCGRNDPTQAIGCAFHPVPIANLRVGWVPGRGSTFIVTGI